MTRDTQTHIDTHKKDLKVCVYLLIQTFNFLVIAIATHQTLSKAFRVYLMNLDKPHFTQNVEKKLNLKKIIREFNLYLIV